MRTHGAWVRQIGDADLHARDADGVVGAPPGRGAHVARRVHPTLSAKIAVVACMLLAACEPRPTSARLAGPTMGTTYSVLLPRLADDPTRAAAQAAVADVLAQVDRHLSGWSADSELARFNASTSTDWTAVSPTLLAAVEEALGVSRSSGGAFDITVGPAVAAWGFGAGAADDPPVPSDDDLARLLGRIGYARLETRHDPPAVRKALPELEVDLDGIAPGWAVDRIAERLEALGIRDYLVELGGEVRARGRNAAGRPWRVAVEAPVVGERRPYAVVELDGVGVSTSGDYRDFRDIDGQRVSHTIDPRTARPVAHGLASVTVMHESVAAADAWATALMVLGPEQGLLVAREHGLAALFIQRGTHPDEFVATGTEQFERLRRAPGPQL